jgi:hypothetical protein
MKSGLQNDFNTMIHTPCVTPNTLQYASPTSKWLFEILLDLSPPYGRGPSMTIKDIFRKELLGLTIPQEYVCLESEVLHKPWRVFITASSITTPLEVTVNHLFLGYKPVVMALCISKGTTNTEWLHRHDEICMMLDSVATKPDMHWRGYAVSRTAAAKLILKKTRTLTLGETTVLFYEGSWGEHRFISALHQSINRARKKLSNTDNGGITLDTNLADQVRIAYAIPRIISLITLRDGDAMNMFPTDLHGPTGSGYYLSSLRHGGNACGQVLKLKTVVLSDVQAEWYRYAYDLGKNHMQRPTGPEHFKLAPHATQRFGLPLPEPVLRYRELTVTDYFDAGIHRIILYRIETDVNVAPGKRLSHLHQYAVQWRVDHQLPTPTLLR